MQRVNFDHIAETVSNWGRWGDVDARGTLNHIGPEALLRGASCVTTGKAFALGLPLDQNGPQLNGYRFNPRLYATALGTPLGPQTTACYSDDVIHMPLQSATHWDALSHVHYDGMMYNGCTAATCLNPGGASHNGVEHLARDGIASRGILLDIARLKNVDELPADYGVTVDDLRAACEREGVIVEAGDVVLVRTGHLRSFTLCGDRERFNGLQAGLLPETAEWLFDRSVAAVAADNLAVEFVGPETLSGEVALPLHMLCIRDMGMPLGEMFDLEALAADCAQDGRYAFLLSAPPLGVTGAFGAPTNPMALK